jgi:uncharacterized protein with GYD domain
VKDGPKRLDAARQTFKEAGAEVKAFYLVMGEYDAVTIFDAPNDEAVAKLALATGMVGNVRTQTMRAFGEAEYRKIVSSLP